MSAIEVILVDHLDRPTGKMEKLEVHEKGLLHRAVTVYVFNSRQELLLQRRASDKYHCGGFGVIPAVVILIRMSRPATPPNAVCVKRWGW